MGALLALLALLVNVVAPPGFMIAPRGAGADIVICTGHGPKALPDPADKSGHKPAKAGHDSVCAFAGHGLASAPPPAVVLTRESLPLAVANAAMPADLALGRGLAAPPPPSQGPPLPV
jgi:hypothetical protein